MKNLTLILLIPIIFTIGLIIPFLFISLIKCLWNSYLEIISDQYWFALYTMFFGIWFAGALTSTYVEDYID